MKLYLILVGLLALLAAALLAACADATEQTTAPTPPSDTSIAAPETPILTPSEETPGPTPQDTPTPALQTYRNEKYGYAVALPPGYRVASFFMERFAERIAVVPEDYAVLTSLNEQEEEQAVDQASQESAIGLAPWYGFARGKSIHIFPMDLIYQGVTIDSFLMDVDTAGIIRTNSEVREESLDSGESATRLTRREVDDNGDFTYDLVIVQTSANDDERFIIRIVKTSDYDKEAFETIFRSFRDE